MSRIRRARPSPAILVAVIALVAALGGSAVAEVASTSKLDKKEKKQAKKIAKKQVNKKLPIGSKNLADGAVNGSKLAGDQRTLWAAVQSSGSIAEQSGGISVTALGAGGYVIDFGEDVSGRALVASGVNSRVIADATLCNGGQGVGSDCSGFAPNDSQHVGVNTSLAAAAPATETNLPFYVAALPK